MSLHPAVAAVRLGVRRALADVEPGRTVVVACSGGADSLALLAATVFEAGPPGLARHRCDRRPRAAGRVIGRAAHVVEQMAGAGGRRDRQRGGSSVEGAGLGPEAAARRARYAVPGGGRRALRRGRPSCSATPATTRPRPCCSA